MDDSVLDLSESNAVVREPEETFSYLDLDGNLQEHDGPDLIKSNIISRVTLWPATPIVRAGARQPIEKNQLFRLPHYLRSHVSWKRFHINWKHERQVYGEKSSLLRTLAKTFFGQWALCMLLLFFYSASQFVAPLLLPFLLDFISEGVHPLDSDKRRIPSWHGYVYASAIVVASAIGTLFLYHAKISGWTLGMRIKSVLILLSYKKAINVSPSSVRSGVDITNIVAADAQYFQDTLSLFNQGLIAPLMIIACTVLSGAYGGRRLLSLIPIAVLCVILPTVMLLGRRMGTYRARSQREADTRIKLVRELVSAMRIIKYYAWEKPFAEGIRKARDTELSHVRGSLLSRSWMFFLVNNVLTLGTALVYFVRGIEAGPAGLELKSVFTALALLNLMRGPLVSLPLVLSTAQQYKVTFERLSTFLNLPELRVRSKENQKPRNSMINLKKASFSWSPSDSRRDHLRDITMKVKRGSFAICVGSVGSGKSTLASALLGEVTCTSGVSEVYGTFAYVGQEAWIRNGTVRDNILFGQPFDPKLYERVISAVALETDLKLMPEGDQTEIGDRGVTLSGGQKQRISIGRAIYAQKDLYILDDPFAAVDAHVGKHLFNHAIRDFLLKERRRTVLLITNQLQYLPFSDQIIFLKKGLIEARGKYADLKQQEGTEFSKLIKEFGVIDEDALSDTTAIVAQAPALASRTTMMKMSTISSKKGVATPKKKNAESSGEGTIGFGLYWRYFKQGGTALFLLFLFISVLRIVSRTHNALWLASWTSLGPAAYNVQSPMIWKSIYLTTAVVEMITYLLSGVVLSYLAINASRKLHNNLLNSVLRAPIAFFDSTPMGQLLTRFSKDTQLVDQILPQQFDVSFILFFNLLGVFAQLAAGNQYVLIVMLPAMIIFYALQSYYRKTSIEIQRLESISRAPILSHLSESLEGAATIRAYGMTKQFKIAIINKIDMNNVDFFSSRYCAAWFGVRLDWVGTAIILAVYFALVIARNVTVSAPEVTALSGLAMSVATSVTVFLSAFSQNWAELETGMNSVERMIEYDKLEREPMDDEATEKPEQHWPSHGRIAFHGLSVAYSKEEKVLNRISVSIKAKEKIGIVGRTGAGKSTFITALFRMHEFLEGKIEIDGVDISKIGLFQLRSKLSIIPQTPQLFVGSLRYNIDPFEEHSDAEIWNALDLVHLKKYVEHLEGKLDAPVAENGANFSVGQRQLISMARVLLRNSPILLLDEATAAVDVETDTKIQRVIRNVFKDKTILTIAHRLNTIMDSDRIIVLDKGQVVEFDRPANLVDKKGGHLYSMIEASGPATAMHLRSVARGNMSVVDSIHSGVRAHVESPRNDSN